MKLGLQIPSFTWPGGAAQIAATLTRVGQSAEDAGFASLWVMDHFFQIEMIGAIGIFACSPQRRRGKKIFDSLSPVPLQ